MPTPNSRDWKDSGTTQDNRHSPNLGTVAHWPTPTVACATGGQTSRGGSRKNELLLAGAVKMFPTPRAEDSQCCGAHRGTPDTLTAFTKMWPTPGAAKANNDTKLTRSGDGREKPNKLGWAVAEEETRFATPQARDFRTGQPERYANPDRSKNLNDQIGGQLNPTWVEWLMGWPLGWTACGASEMDRYRRLCVWRGRFWPQADGETGRLA